MRGLVCTLSLKNTPNYLMGATMTKMSEYEEQLLDTNNPHWMLSYIKSSHTHFVQVFIGAIKRCDKKTANHGLETFLQQNERLR
jgi:hypothetical protein